MGNFFTPQKADKIKSSYSIGCLNYSGIQESPFQFYENQNDDEIRINAIFDEICRTFVKDYTSPKFKWIIGKIDKEWHSRYCPLYKQDCGIKSDGKMMNTTEFEKAWDEMSIVMFPKFQNKIYGKMSQEQKQSIMHKEMEQCKQFDLCVYKTLLKLIYGIDSFSQVNLPSHNYSEYQKFMFSKSFLSRELKQIKTIDAIKKNQTDIFFLQEVDLQLIEEIGQKFKDFHIVDRLHTNCTSAIFIKKTSFPEIKDFRLLNDLFMKQYFKRSNSDASKDLNWNDDTVFQVLSTAIIISTHLSSKKEKNPEQIIRMKQSVEKIKKYFPEYELIIGGDLNGDLEFGFQISPQKNKPQSIHVYPNKNTDATVLKKRTLMQAQKHKANQMNECVKDYILSTLPFQNCKIATINGIQVQKGGKMPLLPNSQHPYDHYILLCKLNMTKK